MKTEMLTIQRSASVVSKQFGLIISVRYSDGTKSKIVIGNPGRPNQIRDFELGDVEVLDTGNHGKIEVRLISTGVLKSEILLTQIQSISGIIGGASNSDSNNSLFSEYEVERIVSSVEDIKGKLERSEILSSAEYKKLCEKLDEAAAKASTMGRKDWINYVANSLTSIGITASISSDDGEAVFKIINQAFEWLLNSSMLLITSM